MAPHTADLCQWTSMGDRYPFCRGCVGLGGNRGQAHTAACGHQIRETWGKASNTDLGRREELRRVSPNRRELGHKEQLESGFQGLQEVGVAQLRQHGHDSDSDKISLCVWREGGHLTGPPSNLAAPDRSPSLEWLWVTLASPSTLQSGAVCLLLLLTSETLVLGAPNGRAQLNLASLRQLEAQASSWTLGGRC